MAEKSQTPVYLCKPLFTVYLLSVSLDIDFTLHYHIFKTSLVLN